ncbi:hypothetical protein DAPPUDRAFT_263798 [Daphnia pulex]|uniref:Uncharacterized protein n=1 Tax=Daphnia pulex TaxID=6669 RepID=E9HQF2_DAPPU|nr:hypothetical protein DAPPUDRAFT_263798 [Daphnia pulex]|eukprot:EFX66026.1 hypothetical protein DAPPUDRAFT_263798 [Daphnia pulex]
MHNYSGSITQLGGTRNRTRVFLMRSEDDDRCSLSAHLDITTTRDVVGLSGAPAKQRTGIALGWYSSSEQDVREPPMPPDIPGWLLVGFFWGCSRTQLGVDAELDDDRTDHLLSNRAVQLNKATRDSETNMMIQKWQRSNAPGPGNHRRNDCPNDKPFVGASSSIGFFKLFSYSVPKREAIRIIQSSRFVQNVRRGEMKLQHQSPGGSNGKKTMKFMNLRGCIASSPPALQI